jgi:hypothetical protein
MINDQLLKDLGRAYAESGLEFLDTKLARDPEISETAAFYGYSGAWMLAKAFATIFQESPELAEAFLRQALSGVAAAVRLQKVKAIVNIEMSVDLLEETVAKPESQHEPPAAPPSKPKGCACKLKNGECDDCLAKLARIYSSIGVFLLSYVKEMSEKTQALSKDCPTCALKYSDQAISLVVQTGIPELEKESPQMEGQVLEGIVQFAHALGVTDFSMTQKAMLKKTEGNGK